MIRKLISRLTLALALGLVLAGPTSAADTGDPSFGKVPQALTAVWTWLQGLWSGSDHGCGIDPDGKPWCAPATPQSDHGCGIDPNGSPSCAP